MDLNKLFEIASSSDRSDEGKILAILQQCSKQICVEFAYKVCLDVKHLMKDKRSLIAVEAVGQYLDTGKPVSKEIVDSASFASASASSTSSVAFSASHAAYAAYAAYYAASYAAASIASASSASYTASYAASYASYASSAFSSTRLEKNKQYLQLLIELIVSSFSCEENKFLHEIMLCTS